MASTAALTGYPTLSAQHGWATAYGGVIEGVRTTKRAVALTFDDGPTSNTFQIVDDLDAAGARATFFWIGSHITSDAAEYSVAHGEELANHSWGHPDMRYVTSDEASAQIGWTSARIAQFTGAPPTWFRSPFNRLYAAELRQMKAHGLLYANYDVTSVDWTAHTSVFKILYEINKTLRPGGIILLHDSATHRPDYLPALLVFLKLRGYRVVTLTALSKMGPPVEEPLTPGIKGLAW